MCAKEGTILDRFRIATTSNCYAHIFHGPGRICYADAPRYIQYIVSSYFGAHITTNHKLVMLGNFWRQQIVVAHTNCHCPVLLLYL